MKKCEYTTLFSPAHPKNRDKLDITALGFTPCGWMTVVEHDMCDLFIESFWYLVEKANLFKNIVNDIRYTPTPSA